MSIGDPNNSHKVGMVFFSKWDISKSALYISIGNSWQFESHSNLLQLEKVPLSTGGFV